MAGLPGQYENWRVLSMRCVEKAADRGPASRCQRADPGPDAGDVGQTPAGTRKHPNAGEPVSADLAKRLPDSAKLMGLDSVKKTNHAYHQY